MRRPRQDARLAWLRYQVQLHEAAAVRAERKGAVNRAAAHRETADDNRAKIERILSQTFT